MSRPWGRLIVIEAPDAYVVVREEDPEDWLCRFARTPGFPAREWAENMAGIYNRRLAEAEQGSQHAIDWRDAARSTETLIDGTNPTPDIRRGPLENANVGIGST